MNEPDILYPAIFVFTMLLIGLGLTMWEFSRLQKSAPPMRRLDNPATGVEAQETSARLRKASGY
ncbi:MAG: hypothetical protein WBN51_01780 [Gammaproteobacteria bacterium]